MLDVKNTLLQHPGFIDNEYLELYCRLIERNSRTPLRHRITNSHHIIPKSWFKLNNKTIDNSQSNLVNLVYRDHVLAHYYLCLCTVDELQYANELALMCLVSRNKLNVVDKQLISGLPLYNNIYEHYKQRKKSNYQLYGGTQK